MKKTLVYFCCLFFLFFNLQISDINAQSIKVTGKVLSLEEKELELVSVKVKGSEDGVLTNAMGQFSINVKKSSILIFSSMGFKTVELMATETPMLVTLSQSIDALDQVVVVGYGTQKKVNLTGAVGIASGERLDNRAISSAAEGLQGLIPNLNVTVRNGDPSVKPTINVRGFNSINGGSPLILVDGVPMDINTINPEDIKSVSVLKDASAGAVYGARAAFGVILIETKKAQAGKIRVNFGNQVSMSTSIFNSEPETDPYQFVLAQNIAVSRNSVTPLWDADYVAGTKAYSENPATARQWANFGGTLRFYGNNNYVKDVLRDNSPTNQHELSVSGGSDKAKLYASLGYLNKDGYLRVGNDAYKRYNVLMKGEFRVNNWLSLDEKIVLNSQYSDKAHEYTADVSVNNITRVNPMQQIRFPDLEYYLTPGDHDRFAPYIGQYFTGLNALPYLEKGGRTTFSTNDLWLTQGITLSPLKGLKIKGEFSINSYTRIYQDMQSKVDQLNTNITGAMVTLGYSADDWIETGNTNNRYSVLNAYAEYEASGLGNHSITMMGGVNQEYGYYRLVSAKNRGLISPSLNDIGATIGAQTATGNQSEAALLGMFYRLNYDFKKKYLLELNGRYDGSSRFPQASRYGFFPSFSAGWRISEEKFMQGTQSWIDNIKIRASYGELGNQLLGSNYYPYLPQMPVGTTTNIFNSGTSPMVSAAGLVSPSLTWENVASKNIGLDFSLFQRKLDVSVDAYTRDTKNMLLNVSYPAILGTSAPKENGADLRTKGWEAAVTWKDKIGKNWFYDVSLALSDNQAEITKYNNPTGNIGTYYVGMKLGQIWGYKSVGIFQYDDEVAKAPSQAAIGTGWRAGDMQFADLNGDAKIDNGIGTLSNLGDRMIIGNSTPRYSFGVNTNVGYKNLRLSIFMQGVGKIDHMPQTTRWTWFFPFQSGYVEKYYMKDSWSETNRDAYFPAPDYLGTKNIVPQTRFLQNAAYIRLKNINLTYRIPVKLTSKWGMEKIEIYAAGMNLWEFSKIRKPLDPEAIQTQQVEYPMQRIYTFGLNMSL